VITRQSAFLRGGSEDLLLFLWPLLLVLVGIIWYFWNKKSNKSGSDSDAWMIIIVIAVVATLIRLLT